MLLNTIRLVGLAIRSLDNLFRLSAYNSCMQPSLHRFKLFADNPCLLNYVLISGTNTPNLHISLLNFHFFILKRDCVEFYQQRIGDIRTFLVEWHLLCDIIPRYDLNNYRLVVCCFKRHLIRTVNKFYWT